MAFDFVSSDCVHAHRVDGTGWLCHVHCRRLELGGGLVCRREATVVVGDIGVTVVAALAESFLVGTTFVNEDWFEMA